MTEPHPKFSSRRFSKRLVAVNIVLTWILMFLSVVYQQAEHVIAGGFALIGSIFGIYAGVGHLDFRNAARMAINQIIEDDEKDNAG